ncbi:MAG: hypothetical protein IVW52_19200 [Acidimicrobiales bacterium]|nr:hypothetical protein [Acidimicrobiales bacterium]
MAPKKNLWGAFGKWTVPTVTCTSKNPSYLAIWVGIGGDHKPQDTLYQTGTRSNCNDGVPTYTAFDEEFKPGNNKPAGCQKTHGHCYSVKPKDVIAADVVDEGGYARYKISDSRANKLLWSSTSIFGSGLQHSYTAECVAEDPILGVPAGVTPLAEFTPVRFASCRSSDAHGRLVSMASTAQPNGWSRRILTIQPGVPVPLANTQANPLIVVWNPGSESALGSPAGQSFGAVGTPIGYGKVEPANFSWGGDPTSLLSNIAWSLWGGPVAQGQGISDYVADGQDVAGGSQETATVVAMDPGLCQGKPAYQKVEWYFPQHGQSFDASQLVDICVPFNAGAPVAIPTMTTTTTASAPAQTMTAACDPAVFANLMFPDASDPSFAVKFYACQGEWALSAGYGSAGASVSLFQAQGGRWARISGPDDGYCLAAAVGQCHSSPPNLPVASTTVIGLAQAAGLTVDSSGNVVTPAPS